MPANPNPSGNVETAKVASESVQAGLTNACAALLEYVESVEKKAADHIASLDNEIVKLTNENKILVGKNEDLEKALAKSKSEAQTWKEITLEQKTQIDRLIQAGEITNEKLAKLQNTNKRWKNIGITLILWRAAELASKLIR